MSGFQQQSSVFFSSVGQKSEHRLTGITAPRTLTGLRSMSWSKPQSQPKEGFASKFPNRVVVRTQSLDWWTGAITSSLAASQSPAPVPRHTAFRGQLTAWQVDTWALNEGSGWKPPSPWNLFSEVTSHHFCPVLLARSESLGHIHSWEEEITQGYQYQEGEVVGGQLKSWGHGARDYGKVFMSLLSSLEPHVSRKQLILSHLPTSIASMIFFPPTLVSSDFGVRSVRWGRESEPNRTWGRAVSFGWSTRQRPALPVLITPQRFPLHISSMSSCKMEPPLWKITFPRKLAVVPLSSPCGSKRWEDLWLVTNLSHTRFGWGLSSYSKRGPQMRDLK